MLCFFQKPSLLLFRVSWIIFEPVPPQSPPLTPTQGQFFPGPLALGPFLPASFLKRRLFSWRPSWSVRLGSDLGYLIPLLLASTPSPVKMSVDKDVVKVAHTPSLCSGPFSATSSHHASYLLEGRHLPCQWLSFLWPTPPLLLHCPCLFTSSGLSCHKK